MNLANTLRRTGVKIVAPTDDIEDLRLVVADKDQTAQIVEDLNLDGFVIVQSGDNPRVAVLDHDHEDGGEMCAYWVDGQWYSVPQCEI